MSGSQLIIYTDAEPPRGFATTPMALQAIIVNQAEQVLLLNSPTRNQGWQVVSGALEAGESILDGTIREAHEECGAEMRVRPLGMVHAETFHYDQRVQFMTSSYYLLAYEGGDIVPGDDMAGSTFRWWRLDELAAAQPRLHVSTRLNILTRAVELYRLWHPVQHDWLQPELKKSAA